MPNRKTLYLTDSKKKINKIANAKTDKPQDGDFLCGPEVIMWTYLVDEQWCNFSLNIFIDNKLYIYIRSI